jgi:glycerol-3-phosphate dehydrogenase
LAGHKTLLLEKNDYASGTSWCSSKLIHGGIRYLEQAKIGLMAESIAEKKRLLRLAPQLVTPLPFLFPVYQGDRRWLATIWLGTWMYALLAKLHHTPSHQTPHDIATQWPMLSQQQLKGGMLYQDAQTLDTHLTLASVLAGQSDHTQAFNHMQVDHIGSASSQHHTLTTCDQLTKRVQQFVGKKVVLATGPWMDLSDPKQKQIVYSKGSHWVLQGNPLQLTSAVTMFSPTDGRVMFVIPWCGHTLVGTTDTPSNEAPDFVRITPQEHDYIHETLTHYFPNVSAHDLKPMASFAGLRTLVGQKGQASLSSLSREHAVQQTKPGVWEIYGGKLTTFRNMAHDMLKQMGLATASSSADTPWPKLLHADPETLTPEQVHHLIEHEQACTVSDVLLFRTLANLRMPDHGQRHWNMVGQCLSDAFGYTPAQLSKQIQAYQTQSQQFE